jgi:hypothetical protein
VGDGFEIETLIHVRVARAGLRVAEVPSFEYKRIHGVSNLNAVRDGVRVVRTIFADRARNQRLQRQSRTAVVPPVAEPHAEEEPQAKEEPPTAGKASGRPDRSAPSLYGDGIITTTHPVTAVNVG